MFDIYTRPKKSGSIQGYEFGISALRAWIGTGQLRMLNHFLRLLGRVVEDYPHVLGGNWLSLLLPLFIYAIREGNSLRKGWASMRAQFLKDTQIVGIIYASLFAWALIHMTYTDHMDLAGAVTNERSRLIEDQTQFATCSTKLDNAGGTIRDKQSLVDTLQKTMTSMQVPQAQLQANIASCISNLAKMNPVVREKISVVPVTFGTQSANGHVNDPKGLIVSYLSELFVITNEPERIFNGDLKCSRDFTIVNGPSINPRETVTAIMRGGSAPKFVASNEYLVTVDSTGTEWNPSHPAFMTIQTKDRDFGCSFTPQE